MLYLQIQIKKKWRCYIMKSICCKYVFRMMIVLGCASLFGCVSAKFNLFPDGSEPLREYTLSGSGDEKILIMSIHGVISDSPETSYISRTKPSMVQEVVSQLRLAEKDKKVKAILLKINSPGGSVTASDIIYHELEAYKKRTGNKIVVCMMDVAASGGYYVALPGDCIVAHPTTVTGSVGVIMMRPKFVGLMDKLGLKVDVTKSGKNKDMGSPFRQGTQEEDQLFQGIIDGLYKKFSGLVLKHRNVDEAAMAEIASARVMLAEEALKLNMIDKIGYINDAVAEARSISDLPPSTKLVVYRRTEFQNDNVYNDTTFQADKGISLVNLGMLEGLTQAKAGFYYLWLPGGTE
jgi:protease-4